LADPSLIRFRAVVEGALAELESRRREVNDLNVFPVADGDTGDNMALTLRAVLAELDRLSAQGEIDEIGREVVPPRDPALRGSHVTVRHPDARAITERLVERGVVPDFREPDLIRLGLSPLTTSYAELDAAARILAEVVAPIG
jgi:kynureninase